MRSEDYVPCMVCVCVCDALMPGCLYIENVTIIWLNQSVCWTRNYWQAPDHHPIPSEPFSAMWWKGSNHHKWDRMTISILLFVSCMIADEFPKFLLLTMVTTYLRVLCLQYSWFTITILIAGEHVFLMRISIPKSLFQTQAQSLSNTNLTAINISSKMNMTL